MKLMVSSKKLFSILYAISLLGIVVMSSFIIPKTSNAAWVCVPDYSLSDPFINCYETDISDVIGQSFQEDQDSGLDVFGHTAVADTIATMSAVERRDFILKIAAIIDRIF